MCNTWTNELSKEAHVLTKQEILLGRGAWAESSGVRGPRVLPGGVYISAETDSKVKDSGGLVVSSLLLLALLRFSWLVFHGSTWFFIRTSYCESALHIRLEKSLMKGKIAGKRRRGQQRMRWLDGITDSRGLSLLREPGVL